MRGTALMFLGRSRFPMHLLGTWGVLKLRPLRLRGREAGGNQRSCCHEEEDAKPCTPCSDGAARPRGTECHNVSFLDGVSLLDVKRSPRTTGSRLSCAELPQSTAGMHLRRGSTFLDLKLSKI